MPDGLGGEVLEILLFAIMLCSILVGSNRGLLLGVYGIIKNIIVIAIALGLSPVIARRMPETLKGSEGIALAIALVVSYIILNIIGRLIKFFDDVPIVGGLNRAGGAFLGAIVGFLIVWSVLAVLGALQEYSWCKDIVESARENKVVMWFQSCSPLPAILKALKFPIL